MLDFSYEGDFGVILNTVTIVCLLNYALSLLIKRDRTPAQAYLAVVMLEIGISIMVRYFVYDTWLDGTRDEFLHSFNLSATALGGVLGLIYYVSLINPQRLTRRFFMLWLTVVSVYSVLLIVADLTLADHPYSLRDAFEHASRPSVVVRFAGGGFMVLLACYATYAVISMYVRHRQFIRQCYSYKERIDLLWVTVSIVCFSVFAMIALVRHTHASIATRILFDTGTLLMMTCIYVLGFRQGAIPTVDESANPVSQEKQEEEIPEPGSLPNRQQTRENQIEEELTRYFTEQQPYLNPELSLSNVALAICVNTTYLSQVINRRFQANFFTFVNSYRIDYAIRLIQERQGNITSDMLYMESGFKSRSVFYKFFRKQTGYSPQAYMKNQIWKLG